MSSNPAQSIAYRAAALGLAHRMNVFGVDLQYTRRFNGTKAAKTTTARGVLNAVNTSRNLEAGGFQVDHDATLRLPRTLGFSPEVGDEITISAGNSYRVGAVANHPTSPEWRVALVTLQN